MADRKRQLDKLRAECAHFLSAIYPGQNKVLVFGEGNPEADIVLIGEAPGAQETEEQRPFVGKAGQNLNDFLQRIHLDREALYVTNAVKFRPVKVHPRTGSLSNRPPTREEVALCYSFLTQEIAIIAPKVLVTLGNTPLQADLDDSHATIGALHGQLQPVTVGEVETALYPLYHPASLIYRKSLAETYDADMAHLSEILHEKGWLPPDLPQKNQ